jgi:hypothetical protein
MKKESLMKKILLVLASFLISSNVFAVQLVCNGQQPQMQNQKPIYVDCSNRKAVIDILGAAWQELRQQRIGGSTEDMCWKPYQRAEAMHPSIPFDGIAETFFMQCNMALQYVK